MDSSGASIIAIAFTLFLTSCSLYTPDPNTFLHEHQIHDWRTDFPEADGADWKVDSLRLNYQGLSHWGSLDLVLDSLPSLVFDEGSLTIEVAVNGRFAEEDSSSFYGFAFEVAEGVAESQVFIGVNGAGELSAFDSEGPVERAYQGQHDCRALQTDSVELHLSMTRKQSGYTIFCYLVNCRQGAWHRFIRLGTKTQGPISGISLVAYRDEKEQQVWFRDLKVWKDWVPFD